MVQETNCLTLTPSLDSCPENYAHFTVWPRWANNPRESGGTTTAMSTVWSTTSTHLVKDIYWPGTSGNLRSFSSSMLVAKVKWEEPVTIARPVPYGEWNTLASSTWFWTTSCEQNNQHCTNQLSLAVDGSPVQQTDSWTDKERKKERKMSSHTPATHSNQFSHPVNSFSSFLDVPPSPSFSSQLAIPVGPCPASPAPCCSLLQPQHQLSFCLILLINPLNWPVCPCLHFGSGSWRLPSNRYISLQVQLSNKKVSIYPSSCDSILRSFQSR